MPANCPRQHFSSSSEESRETAVRARREKPRLSVAAVRLLTTDAASCMHCAMKSDREPSANIAGIAHTRPEVKLSDST